MKEVIPVEIISPTQAKEVLNLTEKPVEPNYEKIYYLYVDDVKQLYEFQLQLWNKLESKRRIFDIEYPLKAVGMLIWGLNRFGNQCQYIIIGDNQECDIECEIHLENVDEATMILYKTGEKRTAEVIEGTNKVIII